MTRYLLDTNTVSYLLRRQPAVAARIVAVPMADLRLSAITEAELLFGLAKRPEAVRLHDAVHELLRRVDILAWDSAAAARYAALRLAATRAGVTIGTLDLLIAAHADAIGAVLVTSDRAFRMIGGLAVEDWMETVPP